MEAAYSRVREARAILEYLAETYPEKDFWPTDKARVSGFMAHGGDDGNFAARHGGKAREPLVIGNDGAGRIFTDIAVPDADEAHIS